MNISQRSLLLKFFKYSSLLARRIYRPVKPVVNPLLKRIKLVYLLIALAIVAAVGNWQYWQDKQEYQAAVNKKISIETEINAWEKLLQEKPETKDIYLRLTLLNKIIDNQEQVKANWERASYLDPNNRVVQEVGKIIFPTQIF